MSSMRYRGWRRILLAAIPALVVSACGASPVKPTPTPASTPAAIPAGPVTIVRWFVGLGKGNDANHAALREAFAALQAEKVPQVYYLEGVNLLGDDGEGTVDGSHPTDLGFTRQAAEFERVLRPVLK